ncbi:MAG: hypothetical protein HQ509_00210 [Candidatus Marinimicrobia bacterium]|nr:hypothetical protein [Candidatus Neomarinimicrobiota bacterium]
MTLTPEKLKLIRRINWDYNIDPEKLIAVISGEISHAGHWDFDHLFIRLLERLSWYELLDLVGIDKIIANLNHATIQKIRYPEMREKYERLRKILRGEAISYTRWGSEYYKQVRHTLFSNRWYSS